MSIPRTYPEEVIQRATRTMTDNRVASFIVSYNAEHHIEGVLERIPGWIAQKLHEVFIIDDSSKDRTAQKVVTARWTAS